MVMDIWRPYLLVLCWLSACTMVGSKKGLDITKMNLDDLLQNLKDQTSAPQARPTQCPSSGMSKNSFTTITNVTSKSPMNMTKKCVNTIEDLQHDIVGKWETTDASNVSKSFFATASGEDEWFSTACPVELITASCYYRGLRELAVSAENRRFVTSTCSLNSFNSSDFMNLLAGRKVVLAFDGISKQLWVYLVCMLRSLDNDTEFNVKWVSAAELSKEERESCPRGSEHCRFTSATAYFPKYKVTFIYQHMALHGRLSHKKFDVIGMYKSLNLRPIDLVVANFGHNFHQGGATYRNFLRKFSDDYEFGVMKMRDSMPTMLWMETSPQHFPNYRTKNGYYDDSNDLKEGNCTSIPDLEAYKKLDERNRIAEEVMKAASIPVLRISYSTATQYDIHLGDFDLRGHRHTDCTHFCSNAAVFKHWMDILYNALPVLIFTPTNGISNVSSISGTKSAVEISPSVGEVTEKRLEETALSIKRAESFQNVTKEFVTQNLINSEKHKHLISDDKLSGIYLTTGKDLEVFQESIKSALIHLVDVQTYFVICPKAEELRSKLEFLDDDRVIFFDEQSFPVKFDTVADVMLETVREIGRYPLKNGKSHFEVQMWSKLGWFFQQVVKVYAGEFLGINDFVLLDSDLVFYKDIKFVNTSGGKFNYAYSSQWHASYRSTMKTILGIDHTKGQYSSGISHHMVISKKIMEDMKRTVMERHGVPLWQMMLNASARETTCRAPREGICGGGNTLSEYDMYYHYARQKFPETVNLRQLMWANGPKPGMLYIPPLDGKFHPDSARDCWIDHRAREKSEAFAKQRHADASLGFDFVGYHSYAKRRYYELLHTDIDSYCGSFAKPNMNRTTCSWAEYHNESTFFYKDNETSQSAWWRGCLCMQLMKRM